MIAMKDSKVSISDTLQDNLNLSRHLIYVAVSGLLQEQTTKDVVKTSIQLTQHNKTWRTPADHVSNVGVVYRCRSSNQVVDVKFRDYLSPSFIPFTASIITSS